MTLLRFEFEHYLEFGSVLVCTQPGGSYLILCSGTTVLLFTWYTRSNPISPAHVRLIRVV